MQSNSFKNLGGLNSDKRNYVDIFRIQTLIFCLQVPEKLLLSACHLMVSITSTVRPVFLVTLPAVQNIFNLITTENQTRRLPQEVKQNKK